MKIIRDFFTESNNFIIKKHSIATTEVFNLSDINNLKQDNKLSLKIIIENQNDYINFYSIYFVEYFNNAIPIKQYIIPFNLILYNEPCKHKTRKIINLFNNFYLSDSSENFIFALVSEKDNSRVRIELETHV